MIKPISTTPTVLCSVVLTLLSVSLLHGGLVAHWTFDDGVRDAVGAHDGRAEGDVKIVPDARVGGGSLHVGGKAKDVVVVAAAAELGTPDFTQMYWVRSDPAIASSIGGMCRRVTGWDNYAFETDWNVHAKGRFEIRWWNGSWHPGFALPEPDTWTHLAWVYHAKSKCLSLYVNGTPCHLERDVTIDRKGRAFYIGSSYKKGQSFRGWIDDLMLFNTPLTSKEVRTHMARGIPGEMTVSDELRFDFETGTLQGWTVADGAFSHLLNSRVNFRNRRGKPFNKQGHYFLDTVEGGHDKQTGVVESPVVRLTSPNIVLQAGGGMHVDTYIAMCALDGKQLKQVQGINDEVFQPRTISIPELVGKTVFFRIVDQSRGGWGHVLLDDLRVHGILDPAAQAKRETFRKREAALGSSRKALENLTTTELQKAITDLAATFGQRYPNATSFRRRLGEIEQRRTRALHALAGKPEEKEQAQAIVQDFSALRKEALLANPAIRSRRILFVTRPQYKRDHHNTATLFQTGEINTGKFQGPGALKVLSIAADGTVSPPQTLVDVPKGVARDPEVHDSGRKILFSMRRNIKDDYHIYEVNADGTALKQLTFSPAVSDIDPLYLPDGDIVFSSTREPKYCMCNRHIMANLFRMENDGANIHQIGKSTLFEGHGALLPDGRVMYYRWEYVDRNFGDAQGLWTVNPDGTNHAVYWGNNTASPGAVIDARPIPGTQRIVCTLTSCHDRPWGAMAIIDRRLGIDADAKHRDPIVRTWPPTARNLVGVGNFDTFQRVFPRYEDAYPLQDPETGLGAGTYFLVSRSVDGPRPKPAGDGPKMGLYLVDAFGNDVLIHSEKHGCFDPMPVAPRTPVPIIPKRRNHTSTHGVFYIQDVYQGTHMAGVKRGTVKSLRVVESPEKRFWTGASWGGQGTMAPAMNWHNFENKRILGTVPVEADGSAHVRVPADKFVFFQLLDENGMMVQSMRSGTMVQPGETTGCVGCHDGRLTAPPPTTHPAPIASQRPANDLEGWHGPARLFGYRKEVQPVFDRACIRCHDFGTKGSKKVNLAGDRTETFNVSYNELWRRKRIKGVGAGPAAVQQAYSWGSHQSRLVATLRKGHNGVKLTSEDLDRIVTWIDINAPYYPSYASAYPGNPGGRCPLPPRDLNRLGKLIGIDFRGLMNHHRNQGPMVSFDRPEESPALKKLPNPQSPEYKEAIAIIRAGAKTLTERPRAEGPPTTFCSLDQTRDGKYVGRQKVETRNRQAIALGKKVYDRPQK